MSLPPTSRQISLSALRLTVFAILRHESLDLDTLTLKELRRETERKLQIPKNHLKSAEFKDVLPTLLDDFRLIVSEGQSSSKFSKSESNLIVSVIDDYMEAGGLGYSDLIPGLREVGR